MEKEGSKQENNPRIPSAVFVVCESYNLNVMICTYNF